jgi:hypothetical protein
MSHQRYLYDRNALILSHHAPPSRRRGTSSMANAVDEDTSALQQAEISAWMRTVVSGGGVIARVAAKCDDISECKCRQVWRRQRCR